MTTEVIKKFNESNARAKEAFYEVINSAASYDECEELYEYICENRLVKFQNLVEMGHMFYDSDPELLNVAYESRALDLIKKLTVYPEQTSQLAKESLATVLTKRDVISSLTEFINNTEDNQLRKEVLDLIEFNKYLHKETINVMRSEF